MTNNPTTASIPVTLHDETVVIVSPLTIKDYTTLFQSARQRLLMGMLGAIPKDISSQLRREMIAEAYESSQKIDVSGESFFENYENVVQAVFLATRKETANMTLEKVQSILDDSENWNRLVIAINGNAPKLETETEAQPTENVEDSEKKTA